MGVCCEKEERILPNRSTEETKVVRPQASTNPRTNTAVSEQTIDNVDSFVDVSDVIQSQRRLTVA